MMWEVPAEQVEYEDGELRHVSDPELSTISERWLRH